MGNWPKKTESGVRYKKRGECRGGHDMIHTDTRGSLDERNPTFFGRFPQKHTVVFLSILAAA